MYSPNIYSQILAQVPNRNNFNLSHNFRYTGDMGFLIPTQAIEVLPGDGFTMSDENIIRFAPLLTPIMHRVNVKVYKFFVPNRLLWSNWRPFISPMQDSDNDIVPPTINFPGSVIPSQSIANYLFGLQGAGFQHNVSALPFAAYFRIYDRWFRQQDLQDETFIPLTDGDNFANYFAKATGNPLRAGWNLDRFTSSLPQAQKGEPVKIPLTDGNQSALVGLSGTNASALIRKASDGTIDPNANPLWQSATGNMQISTSFNAFLDPNGTLSVDLDATAANVTELRKAFKVQEFLERDMRGGTRYIETIYNHFGVKSSDARLQDPEFIGMFKGTISISETLQTSETTTGAGGSPQGNMAGHGIHVMGSNTMRYYAEEHGWLMSIIVVKPDTAYQDGIAKKWFRNSRFDYYWPEFQHIGEEVILNKEVKYNHATPEGEFGYTPRYSEYKEELSRTAGEFNTSLDFWTLTRDFSGATDPDLNEEFIICTPSDRIFTVQGQPGKIYFHTFHHIRASRLMAFFGRPLL
jgi:hypothetical protein